MADVIAFLLSGRFKAIVMTPSARSTRMSFVISCTPDLKRFVSRSRPCDPDLMRPANRRRRLPCAYESETLDDARGAHPGTDAHRHHSVLQVPATQAMH